MTKRYDVTLTGVTPLLQHQDNLAWDAKMKAWGNNPVNKKAGVAGDDRSPAFRWIGYLYWRGENIVVPSDNLMTVLREGGTGCPTGKRQETFKRLTQSGMLIDQAEWIMTNPANKNKPYLCDGLAGLTDEDDFATHEAWAIERGFELFCKRAKIGTAKHVRVRPRFDQWQISGSITVLEPRITKDTLQQILSYAGAYCGLCDWRPSSPKSPGPFGRFEATVK